jgi:hypothetical protein
MTNTPILRTRIEQPPPAQPNGAANERRGRQWKQDAWEWRSSLTSIVRPINHRLAMPPGILDFEPSGISDVSTSSDDPHDIGHVYFAQV